MLDSDEKLIGLYDLARARVLEHATAEWVNLVPNLLDDIKELVRRLPEGMTLGKKYPEVFKSQAAAVNFPNPIPDVIPDVKKRCVRRLFLDLHQVRLLTHLSSSDQRFPSRGPIFKILVLVLSVRRGGRNGLLMPTIVLVRRSAPISPPASVQPFPNNRLAVQLGGSTWISLNDVLDQHAEDCAALELDIAKATSNAMKSTLRDAEAALKAGQIACSQAQMTLKRAQVAVEWAQTAHMATEARMAKLVNRRQMDVLDTVVNC